MAKRLKHNNIENDALYYPDELAKCVGVSIYTIYSHIRKGLPADRSQKPYIISGRDAKRYFQNLCKNKISKNHPDEIICNRCKKLFDIRLSKPDIKFSGRFYNPEKALVYVSGNCPYCDYKYFRFKSCTVVQRMKKGARIPIENITKGED